MISSIRRYQQPLMISITVLIIIAFVWLYNGTQLDKVGIDSAYRIYDRTLTQADVERTARRFTLASELGMFQLLQGLVGNAFSREQAVENFVWNCFVLEHEAERLGVSASDAEVANVIRGLPAFQTNEQFDPVKYQEIITNLFIPNGFTQAQLEELVRDDLKVARLRKLIGGTVDIAPAEFERFYTQGHEKNEVKLVRFALADFLAGVEPTQEEIEKYFQRHKEALTTEEKRSVKFVRVALSEDEKQLEGRERMMALQKVSDKTSQVVQALLGEGATLEKVAAQHGLTIEKTGLFTPSLPAEELKAFPQATQSAFSLTEELPFSEAIPAGDTGYLILGLDERVAKQPLTLEEARPRIVESLKREAALNAMTGKANGVRAKLDEALKEGKPFEEAAAAAEVKVEAFPTFSLAEPPSDKPEAGRVMETVASLPVGGLSTPVALGDAMLLVYLDKRLPVDAQKMSEAAKEEIPSLRNYKQTIAFQEWLNARRKEANVHRVRELVERAD